MYEFIEGTVEHANPAFVTINVSGIGYHLQTSIYTFEKIKSLKQVRLLTHLAIKEDDHLLYGFFEEKERQLFRLLILVNGVGTNTARMILSAQTPQSIISAISTGNLNMLKSVKGVGPKTAQRIILELQDKVGKMLEAEQAGMHFSASKSSREEAMLALQALGFPRNTAEKALNQILTGHADAGVEDIIKMALKVL